MKEDETITYAEVTERLKNKELEEYTYDDVFDRYVGYGAEHELAQVEVQRLFIKHRMIEELLFVVPRNIITDKEVIEGILSSNIYAPMGEYGAIRGTLESTEIVTDKELPQGASWLYLNFRAEQFWNRDNKSWENFKDGISHTKYRYMYYESQQKQNKEEIDKNIGQDLIVIVRSEKCNEQYDHLCCILKNETSNQVES